MFPQQASKRLCAGGCFSRPPALNAQLSTINSVRAGFTLLELLIVIGIIAVLLVLIAPAFTSLKSAGDVTSAAYTIKGVLDTARTYAKANNTYTWVGFYEEDVSQSSVIPAPDPRCTGCVGRLVMSVVASKDGTRGRPEFQRNRHGELHRCNEANSSDKAREDRQCSSSALYSRPGRRR
jgi:prepilin-type N-terminal cleavage/methylation domain-containing protein